MNKCKLHPTSLTHFREWFFFANLYCFLQIADSLYSSSLYYACYVIFFLLKYQNVQEFENGDKQKLLDFANHCSALLYGYFEWYFKIMFSDDCIYRSNSAVNKENVMICRSDYPEEHKSVVLKSLVVVICCSISKNCIIDYYVFYNESTKGEFYRKMLIHYEFWSIYLWKKVAFSSFVPLLHIMQTKPSHIWTVEPNQMKYKVRPGFLAATLSWFHRLRFLFIELNQTSRA